MPAGEKEIFRLHDIVVEEVSLVDRAANKRKFLLVKRNESEMPATELQPDGQGGFNAPETSENTPPAPEGTEVALKMSPASKSAMLAKINGALKSLNALAAKVKNASGDADDEAATKSLSAELGRIGGALAGKAATDPKADGGKKDEKDEKDAKTEKSEADSEPIAEEDREELAKMLGAAADKMNQIRATLNIQAPITDYEFRWQVGEALDLLRNHIKLENLLGGTTMNDENGDSTGLDSDKLIADLQETLKGLPAENLAKRADADAAITQRLVELAKKVGNLAEVNKAQRATIHAFKSQVQPSRAATVDSDETPEPPTTTPVHWPLDMARDVD